MGLTLFRDYTLPNEGSSIIIVKPSSSRNLWVYILNLGLFTLNILMFYFTHFHSNYQNLVKYFRSWFTRFGKETQIGGRTLKIYLI